jgi:hypothetical protein
MALWMLIAVAALNIGLACWNIRLSWRYYVRLYQVNALERLLAKICVDAFILRAGPIWQDWANSMGTFKIRIDADRRPNPSRHSPRRDAGVSPE